MCGYDGDAIFESEWAGRRYLEEDGDPYETYGNKQQVNLIDVLGGA